MKFKNNEHEDFYNECVAATKTQNDAYRKSLFYTLGITKETRKHIKSLYDFKCNCIKFEGLNQAWQTGTSRRICNLAFNLFNGYDGMDDEDTKDFTPSNLFSCDEVTYMLEAIRIRYGIR